MARAREGVRRARRTSCSTARSPGNLAFRCAHSPLCLRSVTGHAQSPPPPPPPPPPSVASPLDGRLQPPEVSLCDAVGVVGVVGVVALASEADEARLVGGAPSQTLEGRGLQLEHGVCRVVGLAAEVDAWLVVGGALLFLRKCGGVDGPALPSGALLAARSIGMTGASESIVARSPSWRTSSRLCRSAHATRLLHSSPPSTAAISRVDASSSPPCRRRSQRMDPRGGALSNEPPPIGGVALLWELRIPARGEYPAASGVDGRGAS